MSPMVRSNVLSDPELLGLHEWTNTLLSMVPIKSYKLSPTLNDSELKCMIRALSSEAVDKAICNVDMDRRTAVTNEISALQVKCDKFVDIQQKRLYHHSTIIIYASLWMCLIVVGLELLYADFDENHDLKAMCTSIIGSTMIIFVIYLLSVIFVRYFEKNRKSLQ